MEPTREIYWNIPGHYFLYALLTAGAIVFGVGLYQKVRLWQSGKKNHRSDQFAARIAYTLAQVFGHTRLKRYPVSGIFHILIFGGFFILFIGTVVVLIQADLGLNIMRGKFYLYFQSLMLDLAGLAVLIGLLIAVVHRYFFRVDRYKGRPGNAIIPFSLFIIVFSGFLIEAARISLTGDPWAAWSPVGRWASGLFMGTPLGTVTMYHRFLWWFHLVAVIALFMYLPFSKLMHVLLGPANIFFRSLEPKGITVHPIDVESDDKLGVEKISDFSWKHRFDFEACTECGRCQDNCPVHLAGNAFSPRDIILNMRTQSRNSQGRPMGEEDSDLSVPAIMGQAVDEAWLWECRTCRACMEECPVFIEIIPKIVEMRRFQVMEEASFPKSLQDAIECLETRGHPYRGTLSSRLDWCEGRDIPVLDTSTEVDYLYWVGCTTALNEDNMKIARHLSELLSAANVSFGIIGDAENCCGEPARRIGNEYLFQMIAEENIEMLKTFSFRKIITNCPHCYNVLRYEYPQFGAQFKVYHHSEVLSDLIMQGELSPPNETRQPITYHDPCYLGRYSDIYDKPRSLISSIAGSSLLEMERGRDRSYCCGGGGGGAWLSEESAPVEQRLNVCRANQVLDTGASVLATACPYCKMMMKDGLATADSESATQVLDIAEILNTRNR